MRPVALIALAICTSACTAGKTVSLGNINPVPYHFDTPVLVPELASSSRTDNPTLTGDLLEIYFTTDRVSGNGDVWFATRTTATAPFGTPAPVTAVNTNSFETSSAISTDGLTLWFGSDRAGGVGAHDIWVTERATRTSAWSTPVNVVALNSPDDDIPRPPGEHGLVMPMSSTKTTSSNPSAGNYQTYLAARATPGAPFGAPVAIPYLDYPDRSTVDGFLTDDGLTMFFSSAPLSEPADASVSAADAGRTDGGRTDGGKTTDAGAPNSDLFVAWRLSTSAPFSATQPLDDLNTGFDERDPWLSPDGTTLYFTSTRGGALNIYTATVKPR
jgi:WD40-like Beta Propeller Repeat